MTERNYLQEELERVKRDKAALISEFSNPANVPQEESPEKVRDAFFPHVPVAVSTIADLCKYAQSEGTKLSAAKYIIDCVVGKKLSIDPQDIEFKKLLQELSTQPTPTSNQPAPTNNE